MVRLPRQKGKYVWWIVYKCWISVYVYELVNYDNQDVSAVASYRLLRHCGAWHHKPSQRLEHTQWWIIHYTYTFCHTCTCKAKLFAEAQTLPIFFFFLFQQSCVMLHFSVTSVAPLIMSTTGKICHINQNMILPFKESDLQNDRFSFGRLVSFELQS